mgnify:CR=1 FL=1
MVILTAEIGVLNTNGVALAADSAVTVGSSKVFNTADKLFSLSKNHPIGIMIYGNATFMGVPWETIVKVYRKKLGETTFENLSDYCYDFFNYLLNDSRLYNREYEVRLIKIKFNEFLDEFLVHINKVIPEIFKIEPIIETIQNIIFAEADYYHTYFKENFKTVDGFDDTYYEIFKNTLSDQIDQIVNKQINIPIDLETMEKFQSIAASLTPD